MKGIIKRLKRSARAFLTDEFEEALQMQREVINKVQQKANERIDSREPADLDKLIDSLFDMLREEAPDSGAMCISLENGSLIIAAENVESASRVIGQYSETLMDEIAEDFGYYGEAIEA